MGYKILSNGIHSQFVSLGKIQIDGLYLRLNNKFVLNIDTLDISSLQDSQSQEESLSADELLVWIKRFLFVLSYFERLDINNVVLKDNLKRTIHYDGTEYSIDTPEVIAKFAIEENKRVTELHITQLEMVSLGLEAQGILLYQPVKKTIEANIAVSPKEIAKDVEQPTFYIHTTTDFHKIELEASSSHLYDLQSIKPFVLHLKNQTLNDWLFKNVHYDVLKLHSLSFQSTLNKDFFSRLQKTLKLDLAIESPKVYLATHVKPIEANRVIIYMNNEKLSFLLKEPSFDTINLDGSEVQIDNIFTQPLGVKIRIVSPNAILNDSLSELLQVYNVNIPVRSLDSHLQVNLDIDIYNEKKQTDVWLNGRISAPQTTITIGGQNIALTQFNMTFSHTDTNAYMQIFNTRVDYAKSIQGTFNALLNLQNFQLQGELFIDKFALSTSTFSQHKDLPIPKGSDEMTKRVIQAINEDSKSNAGSGILKIDKNQLDKIVFNGDFSDKTKTIDLPDFDVKIHIGEESIFEINNLAKIYRYSPILHYFEIPGGHINIRSKDFENFALSGEVNNLNYPIYSKDSKKLSRYLLDGVINQKGIFIKSQDKKFLFVKEGNVIKVILNDCDLHIDEIFSSPIPVLAQINQENDKAETLTAEQRQEKANFFKAKRLYERSNNIPPHITYLETTNTDFYLKDYVIPTDSASMSVLDGVILADITYGNGVANIDMSNSSAKLRFSNFSDTFLNRVWARNIFEGGLFNFSCIYDNGVLKGEINVQNTIYKDLSIVQNILALIDTIPALLTFRKPGLGANGYEIQKGKISLVLNNDFLVLENIDLIGSSIDVEGGGLVKLNDKTLDIVLKASTLKTLADIVSNIPLVNYVLLGDDGKFATGIVMKGTLDEPKSEVSIAEDILYSPFEMVGRILKPVDSLLDGLIGTLDSSIESSGTLSTPKN